VAKKKEPGQSMAAYFTQLFKENPDWLKSGTNGPIIQRWEKDHPGERFNDRVRGSLANTKSVLRRKLGIRRRRRGRRRMAAAAESAPANRSTYRLHNLEHLELAIDDCLSTARKLDAEKLEKVIKHLRVARNEVVMQLG
jgi:hypothetical protein